MKNVQFFARQCRTQYLKEDDTEVHDIGYKIIYYIHPIHHTFLQVIIIIYFFQFQML